MKKLLIAISLVASITSIANAKSLDHYRNNLEEAFLKYDSCVNAQNLTKDCNNVIDAIKEARNKERAKEMSNDSKKVQEMIERRKALGGY